jgi:hypothetical protein
MSIRRVVKTVAVTGAALFGSAALVFGLGSGVAGASLVNGSTTLSTSGSVAAGTPYSSGQTITVSVAPNSTLQASNLPTADQGGQFFLYECTDPGGVPGGATGTLPTTPSDCEGNTIIATAKAANGSLSAGFTVFDLPDPGTLGPATMNGTCDVAPNTCVIGIFAASIASGGFAAPHLFSAPFQVDQQSDFGSGVETGLNPGDGTPEVPLAIGLPLAALAVFGGFAIRNRRRRQQQAA